MKTDELKEFIVTYTEEVWNKGNVSAIDCYYAANYIHHDVSRPDVSTLADYKQWARALLAGLGNFRMDIDDLVAEEDKGVKRWTASGLHDGTIAGITASGKRVSFSGVAMYRMAEDKIIESWYIYDLFGLLQQFGAIPAPVQA